MAQRRRAVCRVEAGRALMRRGAAVVLGLAVAPFAGAQSGCGASLPGTPQRVEGGRYTVAYAVAPDPVPMGTHFVVDFAVCARDGAPTPVEVRIDATMPEHRHGMNYRPTVTTLAPGVYRAEGMLFHMPGRWDITFDVVHGNRTDRLTSTLRVE